MEAPRRIVLVEGDSDAAAVRALARTSGLDLVAEGIEVCAANGVTNYPKLIGAFRRDLPGVPLRGLYDEGEERHVGRGLGVPVDDSEPPAAARAAIEEQGFFVCIADLEDELIRALGTDGVERVLAEHDDLRSFRRFQTQPQHRDGATSQQLRRFMGTRATRKIRYGGLLVEALTPSLAPLPLLRVLDLA
jgi:hypothetical protein